MVQKQIKWVELDERQVVYNGEYNMNGLKIGRWDVKFKYSSYDPFKQMQLLNMYKDIYSGGGLYDQEGNQKKIGKWVELDEGFTKTKQVTNNGEQNENGMKDWQEMDIKNNRLREEVEYDY